MKKAIILFTLGLSVISCGPSKEEQLAIEALESELYSLTYDEQRLSREVKSWYTEAGKHSNPDTRYAFLVEGSMKSEELKKVRKEIVDVKFKLAELQ